MKRLIALYLAMLLYNTSSSQFSKGNWMAGGQGNYTSTSFTEVDWDYHICTIRLYPSLGYFIRKKLAVGLRATLSNSHFSGKRPVPGTSAIGNDFDLSIGPFTRYYLLNNLEAPVNLFVEGLYGIGYYTSYNIDSPSKKEYLKRYSFSGGLAYYINN